MAAQKTVHVELSNGPAAFILITTGLFVGFTISMLFHSSTLWGYVGLGAGFGLMVAIYAAYERSTFQLPVSSYVVGAVVGHILAKAFVL